VIRILGNSNIIGLFLLTCLTFIILYGSFLTYLPLLLNDKFQAPPYQIGLIISFASITTALTSPQLGRLSSRFSFKSLLIAINLVYILSLSLIPLTSNLWWMLLPSGLYGIAQGINIPALQTLLAGSAPLQYRAAFLSANGTVLRLGQTLGPLIMGLVYSSMGMSATFFAGAVLAIFMIVIIILLITKDIGQNS
jgi:MFS family permease